jgi:hypothetical protein
MLKILLLVLTGVAGPALAQIPATLGTPVDPALRWSPISMSAIPQVAGKVDSVFIDRKLREHTVSGGDWVSYMAARLGALPIPESTGIRVAVDSTRIVVDGRIMDLPPETRVLFGPMMMLVDTSTTLRAEVIVGPSGPGVVRFVLATIIVNGFPIPESILAPFLLRVGQRYPVLTKTGRELLVAIPPDGKVSLRQDGVRLWIDENAQAVLPPRR